MLGPPALRASPPVLFFFFQAEDGIRDTSVTGVQTCALPISEFEKFAAAVWDFKHDTAHDALSELLKLSMLEWDADITHRSEERRVGKESRTRWCPYNEYKKNQRCQ